MKKYFSLFLVFLVSISCEKPSDCIESTGAIITKEFTVSPFEIVNVYSGIEVIITQGNDYKVEVKTGENLINDIEVKQVGNALTLKDNTTCNWVRAYGQTKIYITAPNLTEIHSKTERDISSNGILTYPNLSLFALDQDADGIKGAGTNDFHIQVNNNQLTIGTNNIARFYISGQTNEAFLNFYEGNSRVEAQDLIAQKITVFHRGTNDMIVHPVQSITGKMASTGNIILKNNPPIIDVQELYHGKVIYN